MVKREQEVIVGAANRITTQEGRVITLVGVRHWDECMRSQAPDEWCVETEVQGFVTNLHRFLTREEAFSLALMNGQLLLEDVQVWNKYDKETNTGVLYSENLW